MNYVLLLEKFVVIVLRSRVTMESGMQLDNKSFSDLSKYIMSNLGRRIELKNQAIEQKLKIEKETFESWQQQMKQMQKVKPKPAQSLGIDILGRFKFRLVGRSVPFAVGTVGALGAYTLYKGLNDPDITKAISKTIAPSDDHVVTSMEEGSLLIEVLTKGDEAAILLLNSFFSGNMLQKLKEDVADAYKHKLLMWFESVELVEADTVSIDKDFDSIKQESHAEMKKQHNVEDNKKIHFFKLDSAKTVLSREQSNVSHSDVTDVERLDEVDHSLSLPTDSQSSKSTFEVVEDGGSLVKKHESPPGLAFLMFQKDVDGKPTSNKLHHQVEDILKEMNICVSTVYAETDQFQSAEYMFQNRVAVESKWVPSPFYDQIIINFDLSQASAGETSGAGSEKSEKLKSKEKEFSDDLTPEPKPAPEYISSDQPTTSLIETFDFYTAEGTKCWGQNYIDGQFRYNTGTTKRGRFAIFNQEIFDGELNLYNRKGSMIDAEKLKQTFEKLGFEYIKILQDLTKSQILKLLNDLSEADHSAYDCFGCAILTNGSEDGHLFVRDTKMHVNDFIEPFRSDKCPTLAGKPKLFFINASRGVSMDDGAIVKMYREDKNQAKTSKGKETSRRVTSLSKSFIGGDDDDEYTDIPRESDIFIANSTVEGYVSWRNTIAGSYFVQSLCEVFDKYGKELELMQLMKRVNRKMAFEYQASYYGEDRKKKQMPTIESRLTADVFFPDKSDDLSTITHPLLDEAKCPICVGTLKKPIRILPCGHNLCQPCLQGLLDNRDHRCPVCKETFEVGPKGAEGFTRNRSIENMIEKLENKISKTSA